MVLLFTVTSFAVITNSNGHDRVTGSKTTEDFKQFTSVDTGILKVLYVKDTLVLSNNTLFSGNFLSSNGLEPNNAAFDSSNGYIYVTNSGSDTVSVINGKNNSVIKTITVGSNPDGAAFDSSNGYIYVTNFCSDTVSVINSSNNNVFKTITLSSLPLRAVFDSSNGYVYVTNFCSDIVSVINGKNNSVIKTITVGSNTRGEAFDSSNGYVYVTNCGSNTVSVINGANNNVINTITVGSSPFGAAFDSSNGYVYVTNGGSNTVSVINGSSNSIFKTITVGSSPRGVAFDSSNGYVYVTNGGSNTVSVINGSNNNVFKTITVGSSPFGAAFDSSNGYVYVTNYCSGSISILSTFNEYSMIFKESNLPAGSSWYVNLTENNGTNYYSSSLTASYFLFHLANGSYSYFISTTDKIYHADGGSFQVNGIISNNNISVSFSKVLYAVTFKESNLPIGTTWILTFNNVEYTLTNTSYTFHVTNGTYSYFISTTDKIYHADGGSFQVNGIISNNNISVSFSKVFSRVVFIEYNLPPGSAWTLTFNNVQYTLTNTSYTFHVTNGSYSYFISTTDKIYEPNPSSGSLKVNGSSVLEPITFSKVLYKVTFTEYNLPPGSAWTLTFNNVQYTLTNTSYTFHVTNGTYTYIIGKLQGYKASNSTGTVTVNGKSISKTITFSKLTSNTDLYIIIGATSASVIAVVAAVIIWKRK